MFIGKHGPGPVQESEIQLAVVRQWELPRTGCSFPVVPIILPDGNSDSYSAFLKLNTWIDARSTSLSNAVDAIEEMLRGAKASDPRIAVERCPYLGLASFREEHAPFFHGRERYVPTRFTTLWSAMDLG